MVLEVFSNLSYSVIPWKLSLPTQTRKVVRGRSSTPVIRGTVAVLHLPARSSRKWVFHGQNNCQHSVCISSITSGENGDGECADLSREAPRIRRPAAAELQRTAWLLPWKKGCVSLPRPRGHRNHVPPVLEEWISPWLCPEFATSLHKAFSQHLLPCAPTPLPSDFEDKVVGGDRGARECSALSPPCSWTAQAHTAQWALDHVRLLECHQQGCGKQQLWPLTHEM